MELKATTEMSKVIKEQSKNFQDIKTMWIDRELKTDCGQVTPTTNSRISWFKIKPLFHVWPV